MANELTDDGITEHWEVITFPPDGNKMSTFSTESKAQRYAKRAKRWNPMISHVTAVIVTELIPIET